MTTTVETWRTHAGAEYTHESQIPCSVIANGHLLNANGDPVAEDHPILAAEIARRGRAVYRDHGYGDGHNGAPVFGCIHHTIDVDLVDGMNRCVNCGQRAGVDHDRDYNGFFVHDRTGRIECNPADVIERVKRSWDDAQALPWPADEAPW